MRRLLGRLRKLLGRLRKPTHVNVRAQVNHPLPLREVKAANQSSLIFH
jgi:hypothetical protein